MKMKCSPSSSSSVISLLFLLALVGLNLMCTSVDAACKITVKLKSNTKQKFRIQVFVPSVKQKSEKVLFTQPEEKKLQIEGDNCMEKKWVVRIWKPDGEGGWIGAKEESAFIDGQGWMRIVVGDDLKPMMMDRYAIFCSDGSLCG